MSAATVGMNCLRLFLVNRRAREPRSPLERLARFFRLYSYGDNGVGTLVSIEIERAALALTIVFVFDLFAWTLIWNSVFYRGDLKVGALTLAALCAGLAFAAIVLSFEQGVVTTDWTHGGWGANVKRTVTLLLRIGVVAASAFATSQALELLVFSHDIATRAHEELVWEEVVLRARNYQDLVEAAQGKGEGEQYVTDVSIANDAAVTAAANKAATDEQLKRVQSDIASAITSLPEKRRRAADLRGDERQARARLENAARSLGVNTPAERRRNPALAVPQGEYDRAAQRAAAADRDIENTNARIDRLRGVESELKTRAAREGAVVQNTGAVVSGANTKLDQFRDRIASERKRIQNWINRVSKSMPDDELHEGDDLVFRDRPYSFRERLRVLDDLRNARPPQRRNLLAVDGKTLAETFRVGDPKARDEAEAGNRAVDAAVVNRMYWVLFVVSLFVPCMGVLAKLTMHRRLTDYYSAAWQARNGSFEAMHSIWSEQPPKTRQPVGEPEERPRARPGAAGE